MHIQWKILIIFLLITAGCSTDNNQNSTVDLSNGLFKYLDPNQSGINFVNEVQDGKDFNVLSYRNFYNGGGVGIGDVNNDGLKDIYFTANMKPNKLYINKGDLTFEEVSASAGIEGQRGWSTGVSMIDINNDGYLDIYVSNSGDIEGDNRKNELFINNGDLTFTESAAAYNLDNAGFTTHASFFDYDKDGDLDCYILNNSFKDPSRIDIYSRTREEGDPLGGDKLMRNDNGVFTDVTMEANIYSSAIGFGLGVSVGDLNNDNWPDIYISNDFWERDYLYINNKDGSFSEELTEQVNICSVSSMGADIADINNDGYQDIFSTDMLAADNYRLKAMTQFDPYHLEDLKFRSSYHYQILQNCLQVNQAGKGFRETASLSGVSATDWSWGALMFDFDNDGWKDIYVCNGIYHDIMYLDFANFIDDKESVKKVVTEKGRYDFRDFVEFLPTNPISNYAFKNQKDLTFKNEASTLGFQEGEFSNGAAYGDLDNDGDLDLVINNVNMVASVYENRASTRENHYITIRLSDPEGKNRDGVGAKVSVISGDQTWVQEHYQNRGFQSSVAKDVHFGLGKLNQISKVEIIWPDQQIQEVQITAVDTLLEIRKSGNGVAVVNAPAVKNVFTDISKNIVGGAAHKEEIFSDFDYENLLPRMLSTEGPKVLVGDLNGDQREDFLLLGAEGDADKLFFATPSGKYERKNMPFLDADKDFESTCGTFVDRDGDGDLDLVIGSGGNKLSKGMDGFLLRYYDNDGKGNFVRNDRATPPGGGQMSTVVAGDFDGDGDADLFVGGRSIPGNYGLVPRSFLFENRNGQWVDITSKEIGTVGMVTDATWTDIDRDNDLDLMSVGDWMPVTVFVNDEGRLNEKRTIPKSKGWWNSITETDLDGDGYSEFILGNWGLNSKLKATPERPLEMFVKDFDNNDKTEFIINWFAPNDDAPAPFATKMDLTDQLPHLKKKYLKYEDFAQQNYQSLLTEEERQGAIAYECQTLASSVLYTTASSIELKPLPLAAQIAPVFAAVVLDYNEDGKNDIWLGGNFYGLKPEMGRCDASRGVLLEQGDDQKFSEVQNLNISIKGEVRDAKFIQSKGSDPQLIIARNNLPVQLFSF